MTTEQFAYWLQGFVELNEGKLPTAAQWKSIKEHLATVFVKVTPTPPKKPPAAPAVRVAPAPDPKMEEALKKFLEKHRPSGIISVTCSHDRKLC